MFLSQSLCLNLCRPPLKVRWHLWLLFICSAFESWRRVKYSADAAGKDQFDSQHVSVVLYLLLCHLLHLGSKAETMAFFDQAGRNLRAAEANNSNQIFDEFRSKWLWTTSSNSWALSQLKLIKYFCNVNLEPATMAMELTSQIFDPSALRQGFFWLLHGWDSRHKPEALLIFLRLIFSTHSGPSGAEPSTWSSPTLQHFIFHDSLAQCFHTRSEQACRDI